MKQNLNNKEFLDLRKFDNSINTLELIKNIIETENLDNDPFYIVDLEDICNKHINWITRLPRVEPHYAIKCNTDHMLLKLLAFLGAGFDCASKNEIQKVLDLGVSPHRIIFANPCKQISNIKFAKRVSVDYMTFDNEAELYKIRDHHPYACCVLRIITNDNDAVCRFSMKFGADMETSLKLVELALSLNLNLVGISFHVGSGQMTPETFSESIKNARQLFDYAKENFNCRMYLLDLGGGYPGSSESGNLFNAITNEINKSLDEYFPVDYFAQLNGSGDYKLKIIAEPGRYYACSAFTLCTSVIAKRETKIKQEGVINMQLQSNENTTSIDHSKNIMYYINDGVYASFNCLFYDHAEIVPILLKEDKDLKSSLRCKSSIWGPTCDGLDLVKEECFLPNLAIGEPIVFKDMGAYTISGAVAFNGIPLARCIYIASTSWETIKNAFDEETMACINMNSSNILDLSNSHGSGKCGSTMTFPRALSIAHQDNDNQGMEIINRSDELNSNLVNDESMDQVVNNAIVDCVISC